MAKQVLIKSKLFGNVGKRIADKNSNSTVKKGESLRNISFTDAEGSLSKFTGDDGYCVAKWTNE